MPRTAVPIPTPTQAPPYMLRLLLHLLRLLPTCSDSSHTCSSSSLPAQTPPTPAQAPPYMLRLCSGSSPPTQTPPTPVRLLPTCSDSSHSYSDSSPFPRLLPSLRGSTSISHSPSRSLWVLPLLLGFFPHLLKMLLNVKTEKKNNEKTNPRKSSGKTYIAAEYGRLQRGKQGGGSPRPC